MILGLENCPWTVSWLVFQSHMFYLCGGKYIDKNITLSYWFGIDYCSLVTQWLMTTLFFGPEGHMSSSLTPHIFFLHGQKYNKAGLDSVSAPSPWSRIGPLILAFLWILVSCFSLSHHIALSETLLPQWVLTSHKYSLEGLNMKLKLQYFGHPIGRTNSLVNTLILGNIEVRRRSGWQKMRWLDGITSWMDKFQ